MERISGSSPMPSSSYSLKRRRPRAVVRWNWLYATACSSAIVMSCAYMHAELTAYLAEMEKVSRHDMYQDSSDSSGASVASLMVISWRDLHGAWIRLLRSQLASHLRWLLVTLILMLWFGGLILSRQYRLHSPLRRLGKKVLLACVDKVRMIRKHPRGSITNGKTFSRHHRRRASHHHRRQSSSSQFDQEIDEFDLLVVSSVSRERKLLAPRRTAEVNSEASSTDTEQSRQRRHTTATYHNYSIADTGKIILHPRDGATGGRHHSNQIISDDPFVSRYHFQIHYDPLEKEYFLQDLGSTTGTFVFLKPHVPKRLHIHDRVKVGDTEFEVVAIDTNITTGTPFLRICFTEGPWSGICQTIGKTSVTIGRKTSNALCIAEDGSISGKHSVISFLGGGFYITDLNSTNGTALRLSASGEKSKRRYLLHGDVFGVGSNRFLVEYAHQLHMEKQADGVTRIEHGDDDEESVESVSTM